MTRHPWVTAAAVGLCVLVVAAAPLLYVARLVDEAVRTTPRRHHTIGRPG